MKRLLALTTIFLLLLPTISVLAETETPVKPKPRVSVHQQKKTTCPPSYVGQSKTCIYVPNPEYENAKKNVVKPSRQFPTPQRNLPTNNPTGYYFALDFALDQLAKTETGKQAVDTFWNDVDRVDQALGKFVGALPEGTRRTYEALWATAVEDGKGYMDMSKPLFDTIFGEAMGAINVTADDELSGKAGEAVVNSESYSTKITSVVKNLQMVSIVDTYDGIHKNYLTPAYGFWGVQSYNGEYRVISYWNANGTSGTSEEYYSNASVAEAISWGKTRVHWTNYLASKNLVNGTGSLIDKKTGLKDSIASDSSSAIVLPSGNIRIGLGQEVGHGTTSTVTKDDENGETYIEKVIHIPDTEPLWLPTGGVDELKPVLIPEKPTEDGRPVRIIHKEIVVNPDGQPVLKDGTVLKDPVVDLEKTGKPSPVVPPTLPPKDTKAPTGEDLPTKDAEEEGNRWKALVTNKFPFSLPWDVYNVISVLTVDAERPELDVDINQKILGVNVPIKAKHDFAWMDDFIPFVRTFILIGFTLFLILKTRTLMGGAQ